MSTKICTSIEQSKKLLSLGLDASTADMHLLNGINAGCVPYMEIIKYNNPILNAVKIQPCWSLTALLELMPRIIPHVGILCITPSHKDNGWVIRYDEENISFPTLIDAAFELVCWLIEQGHIKVNK